MHEGDAKTVDASHRVVAVIPTFDNWEVCLQCLACFGAQENSQFSVVIADDGSGTSPPADVTKYDFVTYLPLSHAGFATTCNRAAEKALSLGASHLLFLNDDTIFGRHFMETWYREIQLHPNDILGPMIYEYHRPQRVWASGGRRSLLLPFKTIRRRYRQRKRVDALTACALVVPRDAWARLAGFDEEYNTYYEDFDLLLRARNIGIDAFIQPDAALSVYHIGACTSGREGPWQREYQMIRSRLRFIHKHYGGLDRLLCLLLVIPHLLLTALLYLPSLPNIPRLSKALRAGFNQ
jgi:GT2 family glycosyltransferase